MVINHGIKVPAIKLRDDHLLTFKSSCYVMLRKSPKEVHLSITQHEFIAMKAAPMLRVVEKLLFYG